MKKIVLVNPHLTSKERLYKEFAAVKINYPPLGLCYLAAVLRKEGFEVSILDLQIFKEDQKKNAERVLKERPDFIGITSTTVAIKNAANLASELKKETKVPIILGGPHITAVSKKTMEIFPCFDVGVIGEGEVTIVELLSALEDKKNLEEIPGLVIRSQDTRRQNIRASGDQTKKIKITPPRTLIKNLDSLPLPAFDLLPDFSHYGGSQFISFEKRPTFRLITSRGCPFCCRFCDRSIFGNYYRANSADYVLKMVRELYHKYGIRHIYFSDDNFTTSRLRTMKFCQALEKENLDLTWDCNTRVDQVDLELLRVMKKAGCEHIAYGIESGSQEIMDLLNKGITLKQIEKAINWTVKARINVRGNFMMGNPGETKETIVKTIKFAQKLPLNTFKLSFFTPFPGTKIYEEISRYGIFNEDWRKLSKYSPVFIPHGFTQEELEKYYKLAYRKFYFRPKIVIHYLVKIKSLSQFKSAFKNFLILSSLFVGGLGRKIKPFFTLFVTTAIFLLVFSKINLGQTITIIKQVDIRLFFLAVFISILTNLFLVSDKWGRILRALGYRVSFKELLFARIGSYSIRGLLPLKSGEILRAAYLKKYNQVPLAKGTSSIVFGLGLNVLVLFVFVLLGGLALGPNPVFASIGYGLLLLLVATVFLRLTARPIIHALERINPKVYRVYKTIKNYILGWRGISLKEKVGLFSYSAGLKFLELSNYYLLFKAFNLEIPFREIFVFVPIVILISEIPITVLGLGTRESAVIFFFSKYGLPVKLLTAGLLVSFVGYILPNLVCLPFTKPFLDKMVTAKAQK